MKLLQIDANRSSIRLRSFKSITRSMDGSELGQKLSPISLRSLPTSIRLSYSSSYISSSDSTLIPNWIGGLCSSISYYLSHKFTVIFCFLVGRLISSTYSSSAYGVRDLPDFFRSLLSIRPPSSFLFRLFFPFINLGGFSLILSSAP